jgi:hypothetical protein
MKIEEVNEGSFLKSLSQTYKVNTKQPFAVSNIIYPRKAFVENSNGKDLSDKSSLILFRGDKIGMGIESVLKAMYPDGVGEYEVEYKGITGHIDFYVPSLNLPFEIKTCSREPFNFDLIDKYINYTAQLSIYISILGADLGKFLFFDIVNNNVKFFNLSIEKDVRERILAAIEKVKTSIEKAHSINELEPCISSSCKWCNYDKKYGCNWRKAEPNPVEQIIIEEIVANE